MIYLAGMALDYRNLSRVELIRLLELRDRCQEARARAEENYRNLMKQAADGIFVVDGRGICLEVNRSGARMLGMSPKEIMGRHLHEFMAKEDIPTLESDLASLRRNKTFLRERRLRRKDGKVFPIEVSARRLSDGRIQGTLRNITARKEAEHALRQSEARFRSLTAAAFEGICISENGRIIDMNEPFAAMFGRRREELIGRRILSLVAPKWRRIISKRIRMSQSGVLEHQLLRRDGTLFDAEARSKMISWQGRRVRVTALRDITGRKKIEQALRESEEKYAKAFRNSPDAVMISHLADARIIEVNEGFRRIFGWPAKAAIGRTSLQLRLWSHPADRNRALRELQRAGYVRDWELPFRTRDGKTGVGLLSAEKIELNGEPCLVAVIRDITQRVQNEVALRASEESLRATVEYTPNVAVQWYDVRGRVLYWNQASERMYGWTAAEALGKTLGQLIFAPPEAAIFKRSLKQIEQTGKAIGPVEFPFHRRNGSPGVVLSTVFRMPVPTGEMRFVCMDVDLTERRAAEAERAEAVLREQQARAEYTLQLIGAQEAERTRIASELHDSLGQDLLLIKNRVQLALLPAGLPAGLREQLDDIGRLTSHALAEARQIAYDLHPHQLDHLGLTGALDAMLDTTAKSGRIRFRSKLDNVDDLFSKDAALILYRIVQESLNNVLKHSCALQARVRLERDLHDVHLYVADNGRGFKTDLPVNRTRGLGLKNIVERVRILGGRLKVESRPGGGTRIKVTIPTNGRKQIRPGKSVA